MIIKRHLCGLAVAYEPHRIATGEKEKTGRPQGSRYSQQKRLIADATEAMRLYGEFKPLIFVATSPGFTPLANEAPLIKKLTHNLRNTYSVKNYLWVREVTKAGYPHFHFIVDSPFIDGKKLSLYWSSLFDSDAKNSIRLGSKPDKNGKRIFHISNSRMAFYLTKYIGKDVGEKNKSTLQIQSPLITRKPRTYDISRQLRQWAEPQIYGEEISLLFNGLHKRDFTLSNEQSEEYYERGEQPPKLNPFAWKWHWTGHGNTYIGRPKHWKEKTKPAGEGSTG